MFDGLEVEVIIKFKNEEGDVAYSRMTADSLEIVDDDVVLKSTPSTRMRPIQKEEAIGMIE